LAQDTTMALSTQAVPKFKFFPFFSPKILESIKKGITVIYNGFIFTKYNQRKL